MGIVVTEGRADLIARLGGDALLSSARAVLTQAGTARGSTDLAWPSVQALGTTVVLHDPLCPLVAASVLAGAVADSATGQVIVGSRPVTDTVKAVTHETVQGSVDRELVVEIASPVVLPPAVVAGLSDWPAVSDFPALVTSLLERFPVRFVEVPPLGRRVTDEDALFVLTRMAELQRG